jgi:hypothetical protein
MYTQVSIAEKGVIPRVSGNGSCIVMQAAVHAGSEGALPDVPYPKDEGTDV